ncbi:MAG: 50S ribosomal protein L3 [Gammaproteobacteria bacterium]
MPLGVVGQKHGMSRVFTDDGSAIPVTVIAVSPNRVTLVRTLERDGYRAVQVTTGTQHRNRIDKPTAGTLAKAQVESGRGFWEFRLADGEGADLAPGAEIKAGIFQPGQRVDVSGTTIGKGFAGAIRRHNFSSSDATHGNSLTTRAVGSVGQRQDPGKVFKGKRMPGQMGNVNRTAANLEVVRVDEDHNLILIKGAVPGAPGGNVIIRPTSKVKR